MDAVSRNSSGTHLHLHDQQACHQCRVERSIVVRAFSVVADVVAQRSALRSIGTRYNATKPAAPPPSLHPSRATDVPHGQADNV
jgi:hypothetical protein